MKNVQVRKFCVQDLVDILSVSEPGQGARHLETARTRLHNGPSYTFTVDGDIIACAGATIYWEGMAEVWLAKSTLWKRNLKEAVVLTRNFLDWVQKEYNLRRMQADVVADDQKARSFIAHYGFEPEGLMKRYDVLGRDCIRYARVREGL